MRLQIISLLVFFLCLFFTVKGQEVNYADDYNKGMEAYNKKDFPKSVKFFESSLSGPMKSAQAYTNLGLAYHKVGDIGRAVLNFERALRQSPGYSPARQNLRAARQLIDTNVKEHKAFWLFKVWEALALMLTSRTWSIMFYLLLFIGSAALLLWYISMNDKLKFIGIRLGLGFVILSLIPFAAAGTASTEEYNSNYVIVVGVQAGVRTAPGLDGEDIMVVTSGVKARITEQMGDWYRVRLENGVLGWVPAKTIERI
jgi:tetratricopeptide (TPR) repeat protein